MSSTAIATWSMCLTRIIDPPIAARPSILPYHKVPMRTRALASLTIGLLALASAAPASARVPDKTPKRRLEAAIRRTTALPPARPATPGILVLRGGRPAVAINPDRVFLPASLLKLATTTTAILKFGPDHR